MKTRRTSLPRFSCCCSNSSRPLSKLRSGGLQTHRANRSKRRSARSGWMTGIRCRPNAPGTLFDGSINEMHFSLDGRRCSCQICKHPSSHRSTKPLIPGSTTNSSARNSPSVPQVTGRKPSVGNICNRRGGSRFAAVSPRPRVRCTRAPFRLPSLAQLPLGHGELCVRGYRPLLGMLRQSILLGREATTGENATSRAQETLGASTSRRAPQRRVDLPNGSAHQGQLHHLFWGAMHLPRVGRAVLQQDETRVVLCD